MDPPLSHHSDIAFLEWKRACAEHQRDLKSLKHIFISVVLTHATQDVVADIMNNKGWPHAGWADMWSKQLPLWEQRLSFTLDSNEGKALLGTVKLKGIVWMLIQHREHLGRKTIKTISLFRDELSGINDSWDADFRGPSMYIELEDIQ